MALAISFVFPLDLFSLPSLYDPLVDSLIGGFSVVRASCSLSVPPSWQRFSSLLDVIFSEDLDLFPNGGSVFDPPCCLYVLIPEAASSGLSSFSLGEPCRSLGPLGSFGLALISSFSVFLIFLFRYLHILVWVWGLPSLVLFLVDPPPSLLAYLSFLA